jgi:hypothetical protein
MAFPNTLNSPYMANPLFKVCSGAAVHLNTKLNRKFITDNLVQSNETEM